VHVALISDTFAGESADSLHPMTNIGRFVVLVHAAHERDRL
jgi:hypothetical protein